MKFWFEKSDRESGEIYAAAEHGGFSAFSSLHFGAREMAHAAGVLGAALLARRLSKRERAASRAQRDAQRREKKARRASGTQNAPRGGFGGTKRN